jgi:hypothetical protein
VSKQLVRRPDLRRGVLDALELRPLIAIENVQVVLPSNSYLLNGNNYNNTTANFSIKELLKKGDFIRNLASSTNSSSIQETKGAFLLNLTSDSGLSLSLTKNSSYYLRLIDSALSQDYKFFIGSCNQC